MLWAAIIAAAAALSVASFTLFVTAPWLRPELDQVNNRLDACEHDRAQLALRLELVTAAILRTLPEAERFALLAELADRLPRAK